MSKKPAPKPFAFTRDDLMREITELTGGRCLLALSRGKDATATWLTLRESGLFHTIQPFHLNGIPGLQFIEDSLDYFEDVFQTRIIRLPHISFYRMNGAMVYQPPERVATIRCLGFDQCTRFTYNDVRRWISEDSGWPEDSTWTATGVRAADSPRRRIHIVKSRARTHSSKQFYPVFDFLKADVMAIIQRHGIRLPVDYGMFGRSFDGGGRIGGGIPVALGERGQAPQECHRLGNLVLRLFRQPRGEGPIPEKVRPGPDRGQVLGRSVRRPGIAEAAHGARHPPAMRKESHHAR